VQAILTRSIVCITIWRTFHSKWVDINHRLVIDTVLPSGQDCCALVHIYICEYRYIGPYIYICICKNRYVGPYICKNRYIFYYFWEPLGCLWEGFGMSVFLLYSPTARVNLGPGSVYCHSLTSMTHTRKRTSQRCASHAVASLPACSFFWRSPGLPNHSWPTLTVFVCPALAAVRTHYAPLFALRSRTLRAFVWQPDLLLVVQYVYDCFQARARILNPCCGVPSNQPHLAGLM
jgi:hypothetical protein